MIIQLTGGNASETCLVLRSRLEELGKTVSECNAAAGRLVTDARDAPEPIECAIDANDTPDFAAEKILDVLAERGLVTLDDDGYSDEDEEAIRQRLSDLGYIE